MVFMCGDFLSITCWSAVLSSLPLCSGSLAGIRFHVDYSIPSMKLQIFVI